MWSPFCDCNQFGVHPTWLFLVLVPLHFAWSSPWLLVVTHALSLAICLPLVTKLVRLLVKDLGDLECVLILFAFTASQAIGSVANYGYHPEVWYIPLGLWFLTGWIQDRKSWIIAALLFAAVKEDGALYLIAWSLGTLMVRDHRRRALRLVLLAAGFFIINTKIIQPLAWPSPEFRPSWAVFWAKYGNSVPEMIGGIVTHPTAAIVDITTSGIWKWLLPFAFAPLLSLRSLAGIAPGIVMLGLADASVLRGYGVYYAAPLIPFALFGWGSMLQRLRSLLSLQKFARTLVVLTLLLGFVGGVGPRIGHLKPNVEPALVKWREGFLLNTDATRSTPTCIQTALYPHIGYLNGIRPLAPNSGCGLGSVIHSDLDPYPFNSKAELLEYAVKNQWLDLAKS